MLSGRLQYGLANAVYASVLQDLAAVPWARAGEVIAGVAWASISGRGSSPTWPERLQASSLLGGADESFFLFNSLRRGAHQSRPRTHQLQRERERDHRYR